MRYLLSLLLLTTVATSALAAPDLSTVPKPATTAATAAPAPAATPAAAPAPVPAAVVAKATPTEPTTPVEAVAQGQLLIEYAKVKNWFGVSAIAIFLIMFGLKAAGTFQKFGKRWAYIIVPLLSVAGMLLARFAGEVSWDAAWLLLTSGPCVALLSDFVTRGILGKEPTTPINPS